MFSQKKHFYIEFSIDGVIRVSEDNKKEVISEIKRILNKAMGTRDVVKIENHVNVISEEDIVFALNSNNFEVN